MIIPHHLNSLDNANKQLEKAWNRFKVARQGSNPIEITNAFMAYLQTLQRVNVIAETAITTK